MFARALIYFAIASSAAWAYADQPTPPAGAPLASPLAAVMDQIDDLFKDIRAGLRDPADDANRNQQLAGDAQKLIELFAQAKAMTPATATTPEDAADFQAKIDAISADCRLLKQAFLENRRQDAAIVAQRMGLEAAAGHRRYRPPPD